METKPNKGKFRPIITRVKLHPEQAVLQCSCYHSGQVIDMSQTNDSGFTWICKALPQKGDVRNSPYSESTASS